MYVCVSINVNIMPVSSKSTNVHQERQTLQSWETTLKYKIDRVHRIYIDNICMYNQTCM